MLSSIKGVLARRAAIAAAALAVGTLTTAAQAQEESESPYSFSFGWDVTSHFVSYGSDVWGGGDDASPFSDESTDFVYGTMNVALADNLSAFVNVWSDINNNTSDTIGGNIQEIDLNTGVTLALDKVSLTLVHGFWIYSGDEEQILDFVVGYDDTGLISDDFALAPSVTVHWRYQGVEGIDQGEGVAIVPGIKPSWTFNGESDYPITLAVPVQVAFFTDDFGAESGYAYFTAGVSGSVPLAFIPEKYGAWSASAGVAYYSTDDDVLPGNEEDDFFVTTLSIGVSM